MRSPEQARAEGATSPTTKRWLACRSKHSPPHSRVTLIGTDASARLSNLAAEARKRFLRWSAWETYQAWGQRLDRLLSGGLTVGLILLVVVLAAVISVVGSTMRLALPRRSREVDVLKMVGATDSYVRGPFVVEGAVQRFLGAVLSVAMTGILFLVLRDSFDAALDAARRHSALSPHFALLGSGHAGSGPRRAQLVRCLRRPPGSGREAEGGGSWRRSSWPRRCAVSLVTTDRATAEPRSRQHRPLISSAFVWRSTPCARCSSAARVRKSCFGSASSSAAGPTIASPAPVQPETFSSTPCASRRIRSALLIDLERVDRLRARRSAPIDRYPSWLADERLWKWRPGLPIGSGRPPRTIRA